MVKAILRTGGVISVEETIQAGWTEERGQGVSDEPEPPVMVREFESVDHLAQVLADLNMDNDLQLDLTLDDESSQVFQLQRNSPWTSIHHLLVDTGGPLPPRQVAIEIPTPEPAAGTEPEEPASDTVEAEKPKPKKPASPEPASDAVERHKASDAGLTGLPNVPAMVWNSLTHADKQAAAKDLVTRAIEFSADRQVGAAWSQATRETTLLAHLDAPQRQSIAARLLEQQGGLSEEQIRSVTLANDFQQQRVNLMEKAVAAAEESTEHLKAWRTLSHVVVPFLLATTIFGGFLVLRALDLVSQGRLNGIEMALLAFVFALVAISPATLLLIGRPLEGLDKWRPGSQEKEAENPETPATTKKDKPTGKPA